MSFTGLRRKVVGLGYGPHLTIDGYNADKKALGDYLLVRDVLDNLPSVIGMTKIIPPYVIKYDGKHKPEDWGITGFVVIAESHISIHTYPDKGYIAFDIFSCRQFDADKAFDYIINAFKIKRFEKNLVQRGLEFPRT
ncbi:adenosylmethionine decarboxylase [Candidatus Woesearchaeota archaeon]|nr:adenosylmethionine decarboxylase [Candidatus Woesearchaeota archaeon]